MNLFTWTRISTYESGLMKSHVQGQEKNVENIGKLFLRNNKKYK